VVGAYSDSTAPDIAGQFQCAVIEEFTAKEPPKLGWMLVESWLEIGKYKEA